MMFSEPIEFDDETKDLFAKLKALLEVSVVVDFTMKITKGDAGDTGELIPVKKKLRELLA